MLPYIESLNGKAIHVRSPAPVVMLCGGKCSGVGTDAKPESIRDAFYKIIDNPSLKNAQLMLAEELTNSHDFFTYYGDLLKFETDIAQITELILIFCESEGALAELGAFSVLPEISSRLFVVIREEYWVKDSFIKLGPLKSLSNNYGDGVIFVVNDAELGIQRAVVSDIKRDVLKNILAEPLRERIDVVRPPTTFDRSSVGHVIKFIVGIIQEFAAVTIDEIIDALGRVGISAERNRVESYLLCARGVGWVESVRRDARTFYFARDLACDAATLKFTAEEVPRDKVRRRYFIREHWRNNDARRHAVIQAVCRGGV